MKKIIGFFGGDSQVGTTMLAQSAAEQLKEKGRKVLFIMGSGKFGEEFVNHGGRHSIDDLKAGIRSGRVSAEDLSQNIVECRGLWVLPGVRNPLTAKYFPENTYEIMLESVPADFDYIVIDGGDNANLGLTISALNTAEERFFVTTQQSKSVHRLILLQKSILEPLNLEGRLIINKYMKDPALLLKKDILPLCGQAEALTIPYIEYGWQAEMEGRTLLHFNKFAKAAAKIPDIFEPPQEVKKHGKRILFRRVSQ